MSPNPFVIQADSPEPVGPAAPTDWASVKNDVVTRLDMGAEFAALGVHFTKALPDAIGRRECRSIDRPDEVPSAFVNVARGIYFDSGSGEKGLHLFDFALKVKAFGRWLDAAKHYAAKAGLPLGKVQSKAGGRIIEATYDYLGPDGSIAYRVFRYITPVGGKTFSQHPPDGRGGWKAGAGCMDGVEPLPYRLPELIRADPEDPVFICEGEKACEAVVGLGLVATTAHGGSGNIDKAWPKIAGHFAGRECYVLPDNDQAGKIAASKVANQLRSVARAVKVLLLPGLPPKGDAVEWVADGGTAEELCRLAHSAAPWAPGAEPTPDFGPEAPADDLPPADAITLVRMSDVVSVPVEWLWPERVPLGKITLLAGEAKQGKSFITMDFAARVSAGLAVPAGGGELMPRGSVLLLSAEDDAADTIKPRLVAHGADCTRILALNTIRMANGKFGLFNLSYVPHLERAIIELGDCKLVIIDPVTHYVGNGTDDHKASQVRQLLEPLRDLAKRANVAMFLVTHLNKGNGTKALNRVTNSGAYTALARSNWFVARDNEDPHRRLFLCSGMNIGKEPSGLAYRIAEGGVLEWETDPVLMTADEALAASMEPKGREDKQGKAEKVRAFLVALLADGKELPSDEVIAQAKAQGISKASVWEAKEAAGVVAHKKGFQGKWAWFIPPVGPIAGTIGQSDPAY